MSRIFARVTLLCAALCAVAVVGFDVNVPPVLAQWFPTSTTASAVTTGPLPVTAFSGSTPRTWNKCHVKVSIVGSAPSQAVPHVQAALAAVNTVSPVTFVYSPPVKASGNVNAAARARGQLLISFVDSSDDQFANLPKAMAFYRPTVNTSGQVSAGVIVVAIDKFARRPDSGPASKTLLIAHELFHAMGVDHSHDPRSLMSPSLGTSETVTSDIAAVAPSLRPAGC